MNDPEYNRLQELSWRGKLTEAEEAELQRYLAAKPEAREGWVYEAELNRLLDRLPEAPQVSSNFTSLVLQAVEREAAVKSRASVRRSGWSSIWRWLPQSAVACLAVGLGVMTYERHELNNRVAMAKSVAQLTDFVSASNPEMLKDFEPIRRLSDPEPKADVELLALQ